MSDLRTLVEEIGGEVAQELRKRFLTKGVDEIIGYHGSDVTRRIDKLSEDLIINSFRQRGFRPTFVTEESGVLKDGVDFLVLIDPLDGSSNFVNGVPWSSVSIAVYESDNRGLLESIAGTVVNIFTGEVYSYDETNAYYNGAPFKLPEKSKNVILFYYNRAVAGVIPRLANNLDRDYKFRSYGSASLDMILVCTGRATLYADLRGKLRNVDIAASSNFCSRLGLKPVDSKEEPINYVKINKVTEVREVIVSFYPELLRVLESALRA